MGFLEPALGIGVAKYHDVIVHHQQLLDWTREDDVMSQSIQKVQPPCVEHVVCEDEVLLRGYPES